MMILSDSEIRRRLSFPDDSEGKLVIAPFPEDRALQPSSVDLHLDSSLKIYFNSGKYLRVDERPEYLNLKIKKGGFALSPGGLVLGSTKEWIEIPHDLVGRIEGKSSLGRLGLQVHITAGFFDPGFKGNPTLEIHNVNQIPIVLFDGMAISQMCFMLIHGEVSRPYGTNGLHSKYQHSKGVIGARPEAK